MSDWHERVAANARRQQPSEKSHSNGLGDDIESWLSSIGITKERFSEVRKRFGLPGDCGGCTSRQKWFNSVSDWWRGDESRKSTKNDESTQ